MAHFLTLQPVDKILDIISRFEPLEAEILPLNECFGRVLATPFEAPHDLPGFSRSTMDGFAVRARDMFGASEGLPALLDYVGECPMGEVPDITIEPGQTARIWTGGMLPEGADAVVMLEYSREAGAGQVELTRPVAPLENVITADEDAAQGELLLPAGRMLRPQELGLFAAFGVQKVTVHKRPRVAVISSGDEVVPIDVEPQPGQVRDVNSYTLSALALAAGAEARSMGIAKDTREAVVSMVEEAMNWADVVLVSGGSSAGQRDHTVHAFESLGAEILAHGVAISPGKPLIMARQGQKLLWGMPGHVASALVCAEVFIRPLLHRLSGLENAPTWKSPRQAVLSRSVASAQGRRDYIRVRVQQGAPGALPEAHPIMGKSGLITTLVEAAVLVVCPEDEEGLSAGQILDLHELL